MKLADMVKNKKKISLQGLGTDDALAREVQSRLTILGCLDPPVDGEFGPVSKLALAKFAAHLGFEADDFLIPVVAEALLDHTPANFIPLKLGNDFASRIVKYMQLKKYFVARLPAFHTVVYVEGADRDGKANSDAFDKWNDRRIVLSINGRGEPTILFNVVATSEPGRFYTMHPINKMGTARIALEQFKSWRVGIHHPTKPSHHEALVQAGKLKVFRDTDKNGIRTGDPVSVASGMGINQHSGHDQNPDSIGKASAGCLVGRVDADHKKFMKLNKSDARYGVNHGYMFMTAILPGDDLAKRFPVK